jgi:hypothetical protein
MTAEITGVISGGVDDLERNAGRFGEREGRRLAARFGRRTDFAVFGFVLRTGIKRSQRYVLSAWLQENLRSQRRVVLNPVH